MSNGDNKKWLFDDAWGPDRENQEEKEFLHSCSIQSSSRSKSNDEP